MRLAPVLAAGMSASLAASAAVPADPHQWLEEVTGARALAWVKARNAEAEKELAGSEAFRSLEADLKAAAARGVTVVLQAYDARSIPGALVLRNDRPAELISHWPGQHFTLVVDAKEHLLALFSRDCAALHQAVWSRSAFLSCLQHNHLACDFALTATETLPEGDPRRERMARLSLLQAEPKGLRELWARLDRPLS